VHLASYAPRLDGKGSAEDGNAGVDSRVCMVADTCVKLLCLGIICGGLEIDVGIEQSSFAGCVLREIKEAAPFCPELKRGMEGFRKNDPGAVSFLSYIIHRFRTAYEIVAPTLQELWKRVSKGFEGFKGTYAKDTLARYEERLQDGYAVHGHEQEPLFPAAVHLAMLRACYSELSMNSTFLPRAGALGAIRLDDLPAEHGAEQGTFLDRKLASFFYLNPEARQRCFRRRAALMGSLWDFEVRAKQGRLVELISRMQYSTGQPCD
jgi:hypothetical protein